MRLEASLLRYVHDVASGEFANVGVVLYAPEARFTGALCRDTHGRISKMFPDMNRDGFKSLMRHIESQVDAASGFVRSTVECPAQAGLLDRGT